MENIEPENHNLLPAIDVCWVHHPWMDPQFVKDELERLDVKQYVFADHIGWNPKVLNNWLRGARKKISADEEREIQAGLDHFGGGRVTDLKVVDTAAPGKGELFAYLKAAIMWAIEFGQGPAAGLQLTEKDASFLAHQAVTVLLKDGKAASPEAIRERLQNVGDDILSIHSYGSNNSPSR